MSGHWIWCCTGNAGGLECRDIGYGVVLVMRVDLSVGILDMVLYW